MARPGAQDFTAARGILPFAAQKHPAILSIRGMRLSQFAVAVLALSATELSQRCLMNKQTIGYGVALLTMLAGIALPSCAASTTEIPLRGEPSSIAALVGEWDGGYSSRDSGRSGSIWFKLTPGDDHAHGDVLMTPRDAEPYQRYDPQDRLGSERLALAQFLAIRFVMVRDGELRGELEPYWDPQCRCEATTTFTGYLTGDRLRGTFTTGLSSGGRAGGAWQVTRRRAASW